MADSGKAFLLIVSALLPIVNPLSGGPIFLAMTKENSPDARWALSRQVAWNSFFLMVGSYFIGAHILGFVVPRLICGQLG